jgi:hypothetical protein
MLVTAQFVKNYVSLYYIFPGVFVLGWIFYLAELGATCVRVEHNRVAVLNPNILGTIILLLYVVLNGIIFMKKGIPLLSPTRDSNTGDMFSIPGISGFLGMLKWTLLMLIPYMCRFMKVTVAGIVMLFAGVLMFKRGDIMRIAFFIALYILFILGKRLFTAKYIGGLLVAGIIGVMTFSALGNIRESNDDYKFNINMIAHSRINSEEINWLYTYSSINYDVLLLYPQTEPLFTPIETIGPALRLVGMQSLYETTQQDRKSVV